MKKRKKTDPFILLSAFVILGVVFSTLVKFPSPEPQSSTPGANLAGDVDLSAPEKPAHEHGDKAKQASGKQPFIQVSTKKHQ